MSEAVFITAQGDKYHARRNCSGITGAQKSAREQGYKVYEPEAVTLAEARERGKGVPCATCGVTTISRDQLLASAQNFAGRALRAYIDDDDQVILLHSAMSLEHLMKAVLCDMNSALLVEFRPGSLDSLLHLTGHGPKAKKKHPRTISAREALDRIRKIVSDLGVPKEKLEELIDVRDGVVHTGFLDETDTREVFTVYLRCCNKLFEELKVSPDERWGDHQEMVDTLISESLSEIERTVKQQLAAAKFRINELLTKIPENEHVSVMTARQSSLTRVLLPGREILTEKCPACEDESATYIGEDDEIVDYDVEGDGHGNYHSFVTGVYPIFRAESFICGVCDLKLSGEDELTAAGLEPTIDLSERGDYDERWEEY
ncbi:hypothetical protein [Actinomadura alba]|uniref:Uncharacterized protein n=1 Tax=Actinomadura alba TaxID=406431 RepID=A0ABR7M239_9ACTN|nr:hypothetical protein [Actinomadura alba]MBC6471182.1 hypothetical protein [Actinomadura alba]